MPMNWGKLVWRRNPNTGAWCADAHDNEDRLYVIKRHDGFWVATAQYRFSHAPLPLGDWHRLLCDAKREVDRHHHARILESDDEALKDYVRRNPVE